MKANRELVADVAAATADSTQVMNYLKTAKTWGVDASFVAENGVLRPRDRRELFAHRLLDTKSGAVASGP